MSEFGFRLSIATQPAGPGRTVVFSLILYPLKVFRSFIEIRILAFEINKATAV